MTARRCCRRLARLAFAAFVLLVVSAGATVTAAGANFAIRDATLLGAPGAPARATVLVRNGLIAEIGTELAVPAGFAVIDAAGRPLTPGFIVGHSQLVLVEIETYPDADADRQVLDDLMLIAVDRKAVPEVVSLVLKPKGNLNVAGASERVSPRGRARSGCRRSGSSRSAAWPRACS